MRTISRVTVCIGCLAAVVVLAGCGPSRTVHQLVPHTPPAPVFITPDPPALESRISLSADRPVSLLAESSVKQDLAAEIVGEAEYHFQLGKRKYQNGDSDGARREFDRAMDLLLSAPESAMPGTRGPVERKIEELLEAIYRFDLAGLGAGDSAEPGYDQAPSDEIPEMTFRVDPKLKDQVLEEVRATASQLPLDVNDAVLSYIEYFSTERGRRTLLAGLRRAGRYKDLILRILDEEGVPQELIHLAQVESGFLPRARSLKQAVGMWQFIRARGKEYGLEQTAYKDDRLDFEKSTRAAARHLHDLYQRYGDWYLAMAAYNAGPGVVDRAVERTGYADFWQFRKLNVLPRETANYVPVILAMIIMVKNAHQHGLEGIETDPPIEYDTVDLDAPASLQLLADIADAPVSELRDLNPALLKSVAPAGTLRVPKGAADRYAILASIPPAKRLHWRAQRIANGDTLADIARKFRVTEEAIAAVNSGAPETGDLLLIPVPEQKAAASKVVRRRASRSAVKARATASRSTASNARKSASSSAQAKRTTTAKSSSKAASSKRSVAYSASNAASGSKTVSR
ncbi:MAG: transglycosylase SLT domain-containing protein [bacterium]